MNRLLSPAVLALAPTLAWATLVVATEPESNANAPAPSARSDDAKVFLSTVLATTEDFWGDTFKAAGLQYEEPKLVLFTGNILAACGVASGFSYCAQDHKIYIDPASAEFQKAGATGEFSQAVVVALEVAHHVQNITGAPNQSATVGGTGADTVRAELQADCFVGLWSRYIQDKGLLQSGGLAQAKDLIRRLGDVPDSATPTQRVRWYERGLAGKEMADCNIKDNPL